MSIARVVDGLQGRGHAVQLVRPRQIDHDAALHHLPYEQILTRSWPIPGYSSLRMGAPCRRALLRLWSRQRPDVVHIATEGPLGWSALRAALALNLPLSSDFRTNFHAYGEHYRLGWLARPIMGYLRRFHNRTQCTMVPTEAMRAQLASCGFERLSVVSRGVDTRLFHPARRSAALRQGWGVDDDTLVLVSVGRLAPEKNLDVVLQAYEALLQTAGKVKLVFVGDGPMRAELQARCPAAEFAGQRRGEDLATHYASADAFVFPSLTETFGNVTLEAMASGLPVVAFDRAAAGQFIRSGHNGRLAAGQDANGFVRAALSLAADPTHRLAMARAARDTVGALDWDAVVAGFEGVLERAIGNVHSRSDLPDCRGGGAATGPLVWASSDAAEARDAPHGAPQTPHAWAITLLRLLSMMSMNSITSRCGTPSWYSVLRISCAVTSNSKSVKPRSLCDSNMSRPG